MANGDDWPADDGFINVDEENEPTGEPDQWDLEDDEREWEDGEDF